MSVYTFQWFHFTYWKFSFTFFDALHFMQSYFLFHFSTRTFCFLPLALCAVYFACSFLGLAWGDCFGYIAPWCVDWLPRSPLQRYVGHVIHSTWCGIIPPHPNFDEYVGIVCGLITTVTSDSVWAGYHGHFWRMVCGLATTFTFDGQCVEWLPRSLVPLQIVYFSLSSSLNFLFSELLAQFLFLFSLYFSLSSSLNFLSFSWSLPWSFLQLFSVESHLGEAFSQMCLDGIFRYAANQRLPPLLVGDFMLFRGFSPLFYTTP